MQELLVAGSWVALIAAAFLLIAFAAALISGKSKAIYTYAFFVSSMLVLALYVFLWYLALGRVGQGTQSLAGSAPANTGLGQWGQILGGGIVAAMLTLSGREVVSYLRRPNITIMFEKKEKEDSCYHRLATNPKDSCWLRVKVTNSGRSTAKNCLGRIVEFVGKDKEGEPIEIDHDPVRLHWIDTPWQEGTELFTTIDLHREERGFLDVLLTLNETGKTTYLFKGARNIAVNPKELPQGVIIPDGIRLDALVLVDTKVLTEPFPSDECKIRIVVYGDNVKPEPRLYSIKWNGSKHTDITLINEKQEKKK